MTNSEKLIKIEISAALCVRVFWTGVKNVAMLPEDILSTREIKQFLSNILLAFLNLKNAYMKTTNLLLNLNHTFDNCIPTFGPPCIYIYIYISGIGKDPN